MGKSARHIPAPRLGDAPSGLGSPSQHRGVFCRRFSGSIARLGRGDKYGNGQQHCLPPSSPTLGEAKKCEKDRTVRLEGLEAAAVSSNTFRVGARKGERVYWLGMRTSVL